MKLLIETNEHIAITIKSIEKNCKNIPYVVIENVDLYLRSKEAFEDKHVFILRGNSIKILTRKFETLIDKMLPHAKGLMLSRKYPGAYIKKGYDEAYRWNNISNPEEYDHDVALINVDYYQSTEPSERVVDLLPYNLNAKDDFVSLKIVQPYVMMKKNAWMTKHAGVLNFSEEIALNHSVDAAIMYPYDVLSKYVGRKKQYAPIKEKAKILTENFGKIKKLMVKYE